MRGDLRQFKERLGALLREEVEGADALRQALAEERRAIGGFDADLLARQAVRKQELVSALQQATAARIDLMQRQGFAADRFGVDACVGACAPSPDLRLLFSRLGALARECFDENRLVGRMINRHGQFLARALEQMGSPADWRNQTYGENGRTQAGDAYRRFGHA